ncbi:MAG: hypothetical protein EOO73_09000 [Myxococcales bacterium]|nr:MAG: hypothetical protein EOO73_09000 [Myxococcales bacterium]
MESVNVGMRRLQADAAWFARAKELRLLHVSTSADLGAAALKLCVGQEYHADNQSLFLMSEEPALARSDTWYSRTQTLRKQYTAKQEALAKEGIALRPLGPAEKRTPPITEFAGLLQEMLLGLAPPISGLVLVLAPTQVESGAPFTDELRQLLRSPALTQVRFIVLERDVITSRGLVDELGPQSALASEWWRDEAASLKDWSALVGPLPASLSFTPQVPTWQAPGAGPDVEAPPRKGAPPPPTDEQLAAAGVNPAFVNGGAQLLQKLLLGGALAIKEGKHAQAIQLQQAAVSLCGGLGMLKAQLINTIILGSYFMSAQSPREARKTYEQAEAEAQKQQMPDEQVQASLALGMLDALEKQPRQAMARYLEAAEVAEKSGNHALAIESWRTAGQLAYGLNAQDAALQPWLRATNVAATMDPLQVKATSAAECARGVAGIFRSRGQARDAELYEQQAFRFEHGLEQSAPVPQA